MRRRLIIKKRLAMRRRYKERVLRRLRLQLANESETLGVAGPVAQNRGDLVRPTTA